MKTIRKLKMQRKTILLFTVLTTFTILLSACGSTPTTPATISLPAGSVQINGAGATFPLPVYTEWIYAYQYVDPSVTLNYQGIGSGGGKKAILDNTVDFAGSDSLLNDEEYAAGKDLQMYPMLAGAVVPFYNIEGITQTVTLDSASLVGIYSGKITKWNDPAIVALNPGLVFPDATITAVHRSDGSGTTEIFTKALSSFSDEWKNSVGAGSSVEWPVDKAGNGIGGKGNQGVAAAVQNTPNSIGYVELSYAIANKIPYVNMVNKAGKTVTANADSLASAMNDYADTFTDKLTNTIVNGAGANSWPIAGYTYIILHTSSMTDCGKAQKLVQYFNWSLTDASAASRAANLGYSVLPEAVQTQVLAKLGEVTCNGAPVKP
ncbi:MAG: phosphate ABC transporter substrate-binding protein PstS [Anaerolineae bacterium]|nr:phosphate ABC transporter substrate-binding protein PstS [Anaerolineae bacterium]